MAILLITHAMGVVAEMAERVAEMGPANELFRRPLHPYTRALMSAIPVPDPDVKPQRIVLEGDVPSPINPPPGCRFQSRCPLATDICRQIEPELATVGDDHVVACHQVGRSAASPLQAVTEK